MRMPSAPRPEEVIEEILAHARNYDPQKAHAYYLRTRKLKGRQAGQARSSSQSVATGEPGNSGQPHTKPVGKPTQSQHAAAQEQVDALNKRLARLKQVLAGLVAAAKARSGVTTPTPSTPTTKTSSKSTVSSTKVSPKTQAQKDAANKAARDKYAKDHPTAAKEAAAIQAQIRDVQQQIQQMRDTLSAAQKNRPVIVSQRVHPGTAG